MVREILQFQILKYVNENYEDLYEKSIQLVRGR